jgi:hypothetical protein
MVRAESIGKLRERAKAGSRRKKHTVRGQEYFGCTKEIAMVRGKKSLIAAAVVLAGLGLATGAHAAFPPLRIVPPAGTGSEKEVDPPPTKVVCPPPRVHNTPEPGTMALAVIGAGSIAAWKRRRAAKA